MTNIVATGSFDGKVTLFDIHSESEKTIQESPSHLGTINSIDWSFDDRYVVSGDANGTVNLYRVE